MQSHVVVDAVRTFIADEFLDGDARDLDASSPLLEWGIIDSVGMVNLVAFLEERFNVRIREDEITPKNFRDLESISSMVAGCATSDSTAPPQDPALLDPEYDALREFGAHVGFVGLSSGGRLHRIEMPGGAPPWILIPEPGEAATAFGDVQRALEGIHRTIAIDLPGFGVSDSVASVPTYWDDAAVLREFVGAACREQVVLVGHGLGGALAAELAERVPERVAALVLMGFAPSSNLSRLLQHRDAISFSKARDSEPPRSSVQREALTRRLGCAAYERFLDEGAEARIASVFDMVRVPTLFVGGLEDHLVSSADIERAASRIPGAQAKWLARVGHAFPMQRADEAASLVLGYFRTLQRGVGE